jgi:hypothetical protein
VNPPTVVATVRSVWPALCHRCFECFFPPGATGREDYVNTIEGRGWQGATDLQSELDSKRALVTALIRAAGVEEDVAAGRDPVEAVRAVAQAGSEAQETAGKLEERVQGALRLIASQKLVERMLQGDLCTECAHWIGGHAHGCSRIG